MSAVAFIADMRADRDPTLKATTDVNAVCVAAFVETDPYPNTPSAKADRPSNWPNWR